jgi:hypothetical protein
MSFQFMTALDIPNPIEIEIANVTQRGMDGSKEDSVHTCAIRQ